MTKRPTSHILDVACAVAKEICLIDDAPAKKKSKKSKREWFINAKDEFMLTYANTYEILTKSMVECMLKTK
eukprot:jgi/Orpsp1_1/1181518/evm.model.c7180000077485.1